MSASLITASILNADLAAISAEVRRIREDVTVADIIASHEEYDGAEAGEISIRFIAALQAHDTETEYQLWRAAHDIDRARPFGPRLVDELDALFICFARAA
ncbi:hypothetical protein ACFYWN_44740 [Streptomyces sp. NPDC002917]|uniref:hypothetical protein n=1 Tax=Streptomyces sp. NPDC002917 TaxID=3364671 RepID=UPI003681239A